MLEICSDNSFKNFANQKIVKVKSIFITTDVGDILLAPCKDATVLLTTTETVGPLGSTKKETTIEAEGVKVRVAVISGLNNAEPIIQKIINGEDVGYDLIEIMACPGGCISGAGHPVPEKIDSLEKREKVIVDIDKSSKLRKSQDNPDIMKLYKDFYGEANSHLAHELLHTHYNKVEGDTLGTHVRRKSDSAFITREFEICVCDRCREKGSREIYEATLNKIYEEKMDSFVRIRTIRLKENHEGEGIHLTLDGKLVDIKALDNIYRTIK